MEEENMLELEDTETYLLKTIKLFLCSYNVQLYI